MTKFGGYGWQFHADYKTRKEARVMLNKAKSVEVFCRFLHDWDFMGSRLTYTFRCRGVQ